MKFISILDNQIISGGECPMVDLNGKKVQNIEVEDSVAENWWLYDLVDGKPVYSPDKAIDDMKSKVRAKRDEYLQTFVDPYQMVLRWAYLDDVTKDLVSRYRLYLTTWTDQVKWWERYPEDFNTWKERQ